MFQHPRSIQKPSILAGIAILLGCTGAAGAHARDLSRETTQRTVFSSASCPAHAVFLALEDQIRGYPALANGPTAPCQVLTGPQTTLSTARSLSISIHGNLHVLQFLTNGTFSIFEPYASGNAAPIRTAATGTNDLTSIAVDSDLHDYILSVRSGPHVLAFPEGASGYQPNPITITDPNIVAPAGIAVDGDENVLFAGYGSNGQPIIDTFSTGEHFTAPTLIRSLTGPHTGLFPGSTSYFQATTLSIAVNPSNAELYVFNSTGGGSNPATQVSVFPARANGDVAPSRVLGGPSTAIMGTGILGTNKIAVSADGQLFVAEPNNTVLVFSAGAAGNTAPSRRITDNTIGSTAVDEGGIAVR